MTKKSYVLEAQATPWNDMDAALFTSSCDDDWVTYDEPLDCSDEDMSSLLEYFQNHY